MDFSVWAPTPAKVDLVIDATRHPMQRDGGDWWHASVPAGPGARYGFSLDGSDPRPDPRGLRLPDGPHGLSQVFDPGEHVWQDGDWTGVRLERAVVYELHVGTFTPGGTLGSAADRLPHLADLGVTLVELLPLAPFPGRHGWGYDGVAPYAVHDAYGGPASLQRFVDDAHAHGLGVCLDVVYNHLGPDGNYLAQFGPYLTDRHTTPWGAALNLDAPGSDEVRRWVVDNAVQWFRDFHVDALRLDAVHELRDDRAVHLLEEVSARVDALATDLGRPLWLIAESDRNDPRTVTPRDGLGLGIHAQWADDVHHALHVALTGETQGYYADFAAPGALAKTMRTPFFHDGTFSSFRGRSHGRPVEVDSTPGWRFVAALQTHDQVGNRATGDRLSETLSPARLACGAALLLAAPWTPMLFMGEEWGARTPWQYFTDHTDPGLAAAVSSGRRAEFAGHGWQDDVPDPQAARTFLRSRLNWAEPGEEPHLRLLRWYRDVIRLRHDEPDLQDGRLDRVQVDHDTSTGRLALTRGRITLLANLGGDEQSFRCPGKVLLSWEPDLHPDGEEVRLRPGSVAFVRG